jgi:phosphatidylinositol glycan class N
MSRNNGKREAENKVVGQASSTAWTLTLGLVFHLVYIYSVFDCYFTSPVVHGMAHFSTGKAAADRLVLIIGEILNGKWL